MCFILLLPPLINVSFILVISCGGFVSFTTH
jgi:hypothetical protein